MSDVCSCRKCGAGFNSTAAFDKHRIGSPRQPRDPVNAPDRRCRTPEEMLAIGMAVNGRGRYVTSLNSSRNKETTDVH